MYPKFYDYIPNHWLSIERARKEAWRNLDCSELHDWS